MRVLIGALLVMLLLGISHVKAFELGLQASLDSLGYSIDADQGEILGDVFFQRKLSEVYILEQISAWERGTALGWYTPEVGDNWVIGGDSTGLPSGAHIDPIDGKFGLSIWTGYWPEEGEDYQWYTEEGLNSDLARHARIFAAEVGGETIPYSYVIAWEDMPNLGDADFQDMIVRIDGVELVLGEEGPGSGTVIPEPATCLLFGLGSLGLGLSLYRQRL